MTMHMMPAHYTTTNTQKRKKRKKSKSLLAAEKEHAKFLKKVGFRGHSSGGRAPALQAGGPEFESPCLHQKTEKPTIPKFDSSMAKPQQKVYSGSRKLLGIAAMHKSNLVPVFKAEDAEEIAKMRRG